MGFPIRKSADQSSFAAPHGLSQRITSFIASQRQGIHRMLLRHLIVLMIDVRELRRPLRKSGNHFCDKSCRQKSQRHMIRKTIYACRTHAILPPTDRSRPTSTLQDEQLSHMFPLHNDKQQRQPSRGTVTKPKMFPGFGGARRDRTDDLKLAKLPLSQLSYGPFWVSDAPLGAAAGRPCEPSARKSRVSSGRTALDEWWAWEDLNLRPHAYQARALTN